MRECSEQITKNLICLSELLKDKDHHQIFSTLYEELEP